MINESFKKLFWGFLFILLEIHIIAVDILPEPIGYFFIYSGLKLLVDEFPIGKRAQKLAFFLIPFSIPTVFVQQNLNQQSLSFVISNSWSIYTTILGILNIILAFYVFQFMIVIARVYGDEYIQKRTAKTFKFYIIIMLLITIFQAFSMNLPVDINMFFIGISAIVGLITEIVFLVLLWRFTKIQWIKGEFR